MCQFTGIFYIILLIVMIIGFLFLRKKFIILQNKYLLIIIFIYFIFIGYNIYTLTIAHGSNIPKLLIYGDYTLKNGNKVIVKDNKFISCNNNNCTQQDLEIFIKYKIFWSGEYSEAIIEKKPVATFINGHPLKVNIFTGKLKLGIFSEAYSCDEM